MEKPFLVGAVLVVGAVASIGAVAGYVVASRPQFAQVVRVDPVTKAVTVREQQCEGMPVTKKKRVKEANRKAGTVIGGMVGGVMNDQIRGGTRKTVAIVADSADGVGAGNQIQKIGRDRNPVTVNDPRCRIVNRTEQKVVAYDVRYRFDGKLGMVRMEHEPGQRIPVRDGKLVHPGEPEGETQQKG